MYTRTRALKINESLSTEDSLAIRNFGQSLRTLMVCSLWGASYFKIKLDDPDLVIFLIISNPTLSLSLSPRKSVILSRRIKIPDWLGRTAGTLQELPSWIRSTRHVFRTGVTHPPGQNNSGSDKIFFLVLTEESWGKSFKTGGCGIVSVTQRKVDNDCGWGFSGLLFNWRLFIWIG